MKLVDDWKCAGKWLSVHCMSVAALLSTGSAMAIDRWTELPLSWQQIILNHFSPVVAFKIIGWISLAGIIGRLIQQKKVS